MIWIEEYDGQPVGDMEVADKMPTSKELEEDYNREVAETREFYRKVFEVWRERK